MGYRPDLIGNEAIARLRRIAGDASGLAFLPPAWQRFLAYLPALVDIAEAADHVVARVEESAAWSDYDGCDPTIVDELRQELARLDDIP